MKKLNGGIFQMVKVAIIFQRDHNDFPFNGNEELVLKKSEGK